MRREGLEHLDKATLSQKLPATFRHEYTTFSTTIVSKHAGTMGHRREPFASPTSVYLLMLSFEKNVITVTEIALESHGA